MSVLLAAALAAAAAAVLVAVPSRGRVRLTPITPARPVAAGAVGRPRVRLRRRATYLLLAAVPVAVVAGPVAAVLCGALVVGSEHWRRRVTASRSAAAERAGAVEATAVLGAELSAGRVPTDALAAAAEVAVGPARQALQAAAAAARLGGDVPAALVAAAPASAVETVLRSLAACWTVCAASGSGLAAAVQRLEEGLRADAARRRALQAELAGPRATASLLAVLPIFGLLMAAGLGADPLHVLLDTPVGWVCLTAGVVLDGAGLLWTSRLVARAGGT